MFCIETVGIVTGWRYSTRAEMFWLLSQQHRALGWSEPQVERIIRRYVGCAAATKEAIRKLNEAKREHNLQNSLQNFLQKSAKYWSGRRESNPRMQLGKLPFYH